MTTPASGVLPGWFTLLVDGFGWLPAAESHRGPSAQTDWQPIETAPHNEIIITYALVDEETGNWNMRTSYWDENAPQGHGQWSGWGYGYQPTHWMPLIAPPTGGAA